MWQSEDSSILIGDIYDAALDRSVWVSVLEKCARFVVGSAAALFCGGDRYVAYVLPHTSGARRRAGAAYAAVAAVFVHKAALDLPSPPELIAKSYKLSPTELRVPLAIVQVGGVPETAIALGIAESTVKTHLRRLFRKTGASRQADLVKLMASFSTSLVRS